jgi:hypothetical protein
MMFFHLEPAVRKAVPQFEPFKSQKIRQEADLPGMKKRNRVARNCVAHMAPCCFCADALIATDS